jgi:hypothetical protein
MRKNAFVPGFDIKSILAAPAPTKEQKERVSAARETSAANISISGSFPSSLALVGWVFANYPLIENHQLALIMDREYPYGYYADDREIDEEEASMLIRERRIPGAKRIEQLRYRKNKDGELLIVNGKPVTRAWTDKHAKKYRADMLEGKDPSSWQAALKNTQSGVTHELIEQAMEAFQNWKNSPAGAKYRAKREAAVTSAQRKVQLPKTSMPAPPVYNTSEQDDDIDID